MAGDVTANTPVRVRTNGGRGEGSTGDEGSGTGEASGKASTSDRDRDEAVQARDGGDGAARGDAEPSSQVRQGVGLQRAKEGKAGEEKDKRGGGRHSRRGERRSNEG